MRSSHNWDRWINNLIFLWKSRDWNFSRGPAKIAIGRKVQKISYKWADGIKYYAQSSDKTIPCELRCDFSRGPCQNHVTKILKVKKSKMLHRLFPKEFDSRKTSSPTVLIDFSNFTDVHENFGHIFLVIYRHFDLCRENLWLSSSSQDPRIPSLGSMSYISILDLKNYQLEYWPIFSW